MNNITKTNRKNNPPQKIKVLWWMVSKNLKGEPATSFDSFNANFDTAFRTHISIFRQKLDIEITDKYHRNPISGTRYKHYFLTPQGLTKAKIILSKYGLGMEDKK